MSESGWAQTPQGGLRGGAVLPIGMAVLWACVGRAYTGAPGDAAGGRGIRFFSDASGRELVEGNLVWQTPKALLETIPNDQLAPCHFWLGYLGHRARDVEARDRRVRSVGEAVRTAGGAGVEVVVLDALYGAHGVFKSFDHLVVFTCGAQAAALRRSLTEVGAKQVDLKAMQTMRPLAELLVAPARAPLRRLSDVSEVVVVSYYDGRAWRARPWYHVSTEIAEGPSALPYEACAKLLGFLASGPKVLYKGETRWTVLHLSLDDPDDFRLDDREVRAYLTKGPLAPR